MTFTKIRQWAVAAGVAASLLGGGLSGGTHKASAQTIIGGQYGVPITFQAVNDTLVYVLEDSHKLWREYGTWQNNGRSLVDIDVQQFQALDSTTVYVLDMKGNLWRETGSNATRAFVASNVAQFQVVVSASNFAQYQAVDSTTVYVLGTNGDLWRLTGNNTMRTLGAPNNTMGTLVDYDVYQFQALDGYTVYVEGTDKNLWREYGTSATRTFVDSGVTGFQPMGDGIVYVAEGFGLWREYGTRATRTFVDSGVFEFQAINDTLVYVARIDRSIWLDYGTSAIRMLIDPVPGDSNLFPTQFQAMGDGIVYVEGDDGNLWREVPYSYWRTRTLVDKYVLTYCGDLCGT